MPSYYNLPPQFGNASVEDINKFQQLPFYLVKNEVRQYARWNVFDMLYGKIDWEPNMGNVMRGVTPQGAPVQQPFFFPLPITGLPNKDIHEITESQENASVMWHRFESKQFAFVPSFASFWRDHIVYADNDLAKHVQVANNIFIKTQMWSKAPNIYVAGVGLQAAPTAAMDGTYALPNSKTQTWLQSILPTIKTNLSLRELYRASLSLNCDLGAPPFESVSNMPKDDEGFRQKYVLVTSDEAFSNFPFDSDTNLLKSINLDLLFDYFHGLLFGNITCKFDPYPLRFDINGFPTPQEVQDALTNKRVPNPGYTYLPSMLPAGVAPTGGSTAQPLAANCSPTEVAWLLGADAIKTIKVGPPPKEFATQSMKASKFYSLRWNGEIQLTDQVLIQYPDGTLDLNVYGTQLKLISQLTMGVLGGEVRWMLPIIFTRKRPVSLA